MLAASRDSNKKHAAWKLELEAENKMLKDKKTYTMDNKDYH